MIKRGFIPSLLFGSMLAMCICTLFEAGHSSITVFFEELAIAVCFPNFCIALIEYAKESE